MSKLRRAAVVAVVAAASAACEVLVGITDRELERTDAGTDAPSGGQDATGEGDAFAPPALDATVADTGSEAPTTPADAVADGNGEPPSGDAGGSSSPDADSAAAAEMPDADAGPATPDASEAASADPDLPCSDQGTTAFCDDFDDASTVGQGWQAYNVLADGSAAQLDTVVYVSPPKSAQFVIPPIAGKVAGVQLDQTIGSFPNGLRYAFDYRIDSPSWTSFPQVCVGQIYLRWGAASVVEVNFVVGPGQGQTLQVYLSDGGALNVNPPADAGPQLATWHRVAIAYTSDGTLTLLLDGQTVGSVYVGEGAADTVQLLAGGVYVNAYGTETATFEIDNVVLKAQ